MVFGGGVLFGDWVVVGAEVIEASVVEAEVTEAALVEAGVVTAGVVKADVDGVPKAVGSDVSSTAVENVGSCDKVTN